MKVIWTISAAMRRSGSPGWPPGRPQEWVAAAVTQIPSPDVRVPSSYLINGILSCPQPLPPCAPVRLAAIERYDLQSALNTHLTACLLSGVARPQPPLPLGCPSEAPPWCLQGAPSFPSRLSSSLATEAVTLFPLSTCPFSLHSCFQKGEKAF